MKRQMLDGSQGKELILKGELVLQRIATLKEEMQTALQESDQLRLNISEATSLDLSFLQLLCSGHRSAVQMDKSFRLVGKLPEDFHRKLDEAGFARHVGCRHDGQNTCIWMAQDG